MSHADHEWAREQVAAHLAGGLPADERARLESHVSGCAECIAELDAARRFERSVDRLFAPVRPTVGLEERVIRKLREKRERRPLGLVGRLVLGAAAAGLVGAVGYFFVETTDTVAREVARGPYLDSVRSRLLAQSGAKDTSASLRTYSAAQADFRANDLNGDRVQDFSTLDVAGLYAGDENKSGKGIPDLSGRLHSRLDSAGELVWADTGRAVGLADELSASTAKYRQDFGINPPGDPRGPMSGAAFAGGEGAQGKWHYKGESGYAAAEGKELDKLRDNRPGPPPPPTVPVDDLKKVGGANNGMVLTVQPTDNYYAFKADAPAAENTRLALGVDGGLYFKPGSGEELARKPAGDPAKAPEKTPVPAPAKPELKPADPAGQEPQQPPPAAAPQQRRIIIRSGQMEFEVDSFDSAAATIDKIVRENGGEVATVNSERLPNGKVRGTVVVRCPPERLDFLVPGLRALGDLKSQRIGSQDITKDYYDLESRLKAARQMEERLLRIIKEGTGAIKDLLLAEKELGEWRTRIEAFEGERRYYDSQVSRSTLTITLTEREIRAPYAVTETETVHMGLEVEDVEIAHKAALAAVAEAKGRVTKSELKQHEAGQLQALVHFEVAPDASGPLRDRLKQLGLVVRLEAQRQQKTEGGTGRVQEVKVKQTDSQFEVSIFNVANVQPRETVQLSLACEKAEDAYTAILARVKDVGGRIVTSNLNRQKSEQTTGTVQFEVKEGVAEALLKEVLALGEQMAYQRIEADDRANSTKSKRGFLCRLFALGAVQPRETTVIQLAARDVADAYRKIQAAVQEAGGRVLKANLNENDRQNVNAELEFDVRRGKPDEGVEKALLAAGDLLTRSSTRAQDAENVIDSKVYRRVTLLNIERLAPRESFLLGIDVSDVDGAVTSLEAIVGDFKGRVLDSRHERNSSRRVSKLLIQVPLVQARGAVERARKLGSVLVFNASRNPQVPESELAVARLDVTVSTDLIVSGDAGPMANIRRGFSFSLQAGSVALMCLMVGLCFVLPVALVGWGGWRVWRKLSPKAAA